MTKKQSEQMKKYFIYGGVAVAAITGFLFFTEKGKAIKTKLLAYFK